MPYFGGFNIVVILVIIKNKYVKIPIINGKKKATVTVRGVAVRVILPLIIIDCIQE